MSSSECVAAEFACLVLLLEARFARDSQLVLVLPWCCRLITHHILLLLPPASNADPPAQAR